MPAHRPKSHFGPIFRRHIFLKVFFTQFLLNFHTPKTRILYQMRGRRYRALLSRLAAKPLGVLAANSCQLKGLAGLTGSGLYGGALRLAAKPRQSYWLRVCAYSVRVSVAQDTRRNGRMMAGAHRVLALVLLLHFSLDNDSGLCYNEAIVGVGGGSCGTVAPRMRASHRRSYPARAYLLRWHAVPCSTDLR